MNDLETRFGLLLGHQPSDAEIKELYRVRDALGLKDNDALWLVLIALQHYKTQYEKIPPEITQATADITARVSAATKEEAKASIHAMKAELMNAVTDAANQVANGAAHQAAVKVKTQWLVGCVVALTIGLAVTGWFAFQAGAKHGWDQGYQQMHAEEAVTQ